MRKLAPIPTWWLVRLGRAARRATPALAVALAGAAPARAQWRPADAAVALAARDPRVAAALRAVNAIDSALVADDRAGFARALAADLAVNNPQNGVSVRGATAQRAAAGQIRYRRYERTVEYAGVRGAMVVLMGEERVVPRDGVSAGREVRRRFTDLWQPAGGPEGRSDGGSEGGRWVLTARQATVVEAPTGGPACPPAGAPPTPAPR